MVDPKLLKAYQDTRYVISTCNGRFTLRVGEQSEQLDALLKEHRAKSCALITAWNPGSIMLSAKNNARRQHDLIAEVRKRGYAFLNGQGVGSDGNWPPEDSILIIGIRRQEAVEIGRLYGQLCIIYADCLSPVKLLLCGEQGHEARGGP